MRTYSLRVRLLLWAAFGVSLALLVAGIVIAAIFTSNVEQRVHQDLDATFTRLAALIDHESSPPSLAAALADPRYDTPFSGLYWQIRDLDTALVGRSRSLWDFELQAAPPPANSPRAWFAVISGPDGHELTALVRQVRVNAEAGERALQVIVAEDRSVLAASINQFGRDLALALLVLGAGLVLAAWLHVHVGLMPMRAIREGVEDIRRGRAERLTGRHPAEVTPLIGEVNDLLRSQQASIEFARARAADLAHGLKTPLAVLSTIAAELRQRGEVASADVIEELSADMADRVDYQLRLSRLHQRTRSQVLSASLNEALDKAVLVLKRTRAGEELNWGVDAEPELWVDIDPHDLTELVGVILENAAKWGKSKVSITAHRRDEKAVVEVEDDGPGLPDPQLETVVERGRKHDEAGHGSGLGLAIAAEIVQLNRGTLEFGHAGLGGLSVELALPLSS